jgi:hypothetical protein
MASPFDVMGMDQALPFAASQWGPSLALGHPRPSKSVIFPYHSGHVFRTPRISRAGRRPNDRYERTCKKNCRRPAPLGGAPPMRNPLPKASAVGGRNPHAQPP